MIVIPVVLSEQLQLAADDLKARLAIEYARHALAVCYPGDSAELDSILDTALRFLDGVVSIESVGEARSRLWDVGPPLHIAGGSLTSAALRAACQRDLEAAGFVKARKHRTDVLYVAKTARSEVAGCASSSEMAQSAAWEEARWQLMRLIELTPNPNE